jgi:hypothetical protein
LILVEKVLAQRLPLARPTPAGRDRAVLCRA